MAQTIQEIGTYWFGNGKYQIAVNVLHKDVPVMGEVQDKKRPKLERFRKAYNLYYDLNNNGGWNYPTAVARFFNIPGFRSELKYGWRLSSTNTARVEAKMDQVIKEAMEEWEKVNSPC